jgi:aspartate-semialdehyde dehydrogenase
LDSNRVTTVALVGGESLIAKEIRELLNEQRPDIHLELVSGEPDSAKLARDDQGEAVVLRPLSAEAIAGASVVFLTGTPESSLRAVDIIEQQGGGALIDLTGALEENGRARLRAPVLEPIEDQRTPGAIHVIAHPAAVALALFYSRIATRFSIARSVVEIFEPASERGQQGLRELQTQTVNLLSFKALPKDVFDAQLGFNMLPQYGEQAPQALIDVEARIDRHLATLLLMSARMPMPSLRLVQGPVFHGYSCSIWVEFESSPDITDIEQELASAQVEVRSAGEEAPTNVGAAGQSGISIGAIRQDRNNSRALWFWLVCDNLRTFAETAVAVAKEYL